MPQKNAAGYELAATRLLNRGRKLSSGDSEKRGQADLLIAAANAFALLDLASAIRGQKADSEGVVEDSEDIDDASGEDASADDASDVAAEPA